MILFTSLMPKVISKDFLRIIVIIGLFKSQLLIAGGGPVNSNQFDSIGNLYIISIGINKYPEPYIFRFCESDAKDLTHKIKDDFINLDFSDTNKARKIIDHTLLTYGSTKSNIKLVFDSVAKAAKPNDVFVFLFSGLTKESEKGDTYLIPYIDSSYNIEDSSYMFANAISTTLLSKWMESISAKQQLIISEAGNGREFGKNLISSLFESNPILAEDNNRQRIIITTSDLGYDGCLCTNSSHSSGPLALFLKSTRNIFDVFVDLDAYEFELRSIEMLCNPFENNKIYSRIYTENHYNFLRAKNSKFRGTPVETLESDNKLPVQYGPRTYALIIGTNQYGNNPDWLDLKNPINDALAVDSILKNKYGIETKVLENPTKDSLLWAIFSYKKILKPKDQFVIFIAGHGYYDPNYSDGFVVTTDAKPMETDLTRSSYLQMATLNRLLDNLPSKQVFCILDMCFGASFDINARDLAVNRYASNQSDIELEEFIERKSQYFSRVFLASGKGSVPDFWSAEKNHSPFANKLLNSLSQTNDFTTPGRLFSAVEQNITEPVLKEFGKNESRGEFILRVWK